MFKGLRYKAVWFFASCFLAACIFIMGISLIKTISDEKDKFTIAIDSVFTPEFNNILNQAVNTPQIVNKDSANNIITGIDYLRIYSLVVEKAVPLGLDTDRTLSVYDNDNALRYTSGSLNSQIPESVKKAKADKPCVINGLFDDTQEYSFRLTSSTGDEVIVCIYDDKSSLKSFIHDYVILTIELLVLMLLLSIILGMVLGYIAGKPIRQFNEKAKRITSGDIGALGEIPLDRELAELGDTLTEMAQTLNKSSAEAKNEKNKLEIILQSMSDGVLAFDVDGKLIHINSEAKRIIGIEYVDDISFDSFFKELNANISLGDILYINDGEAIERRINIDDRIARLVFSSFKLENKISGIVVVLYDITKQEKLEEARRNFVANVSHELRTPLTTIKTYSETLIDTPDGGPELTKKFLTTISSEADRMVRIISDLLALSQLDEKHRAFKPPETIDVRDMVSRITERMLLQAQEKGISLSFRPINEVPSLLGDSDGLERVIINIIGNAIKYTPSGGEVIVYLSKIFDDICIKVSDTGIGIPSESIPHLFERFYRVDKARSRDRGGTGLGLAIAKETVENDFKGRITITSELGKGSDVSIVLPIKK